MNTRTSAGRSAAHPRRTAPHPPRTATPRGRTAPHPRRPAALAAVALLVASLAAGCGGGNGGGTTTGPGADASPRTTDGTSGGTSQAPGDGGTSRTGPPSTGAAPSTPAGTSPARPRQVRVSAYFLHGEQVSPAPRQATAPGTAAGALRALLAGPTPYEKRYDRTTAIPRGTVLNSVAVHGRTATVDLSGRYDDGGGSLSMRARIAQVVFTATQFPSIQKVSFALDGKPVTALGGEGVDVHRPLGRADFEDLTPAVLVESPLIGDTIHSPVRVRGSANTFEATFRLRIKDAAGTTVAYPYVTATSGTGTRGTFDVTIPYRTAHTGTGRLIASYDSPKDGRPVIVDTIPLTLRR
ncbi:Gmad2 immunoglobulin-like domain-containing protein [Streptomyces sp. NPDC007264]|uniref:Gmad2 immunoglobulin-like domain-containing protein n=1 Tax=Streptomyces sp. NPDC007264 TaxID=3364777 RepID=UPI0036D76498